MSEKLLQFMRSIQCLLTKVSPLKNNFGNIEKCMTYSKNTDHKEKEASRILQYKKNNKGMRMCLLCGKCAGVMQLASGCQLLAGNECLKKHNNVLMFLTTTWVGKKELLKKCQ